jgi:hypothetical protein
MIQQTHAGCQSEPPGGTLANFYILDCVLNKAVNPGAYWDYLSHYEIGS